MLILTRSRDNIQHMAKEINTEIANVAFAGLTAAGKTTHSKILAEQLGFKYVSATQTILDIIGMDEVPDRVWFDKYDEVEQGSKLYILVEELLRWRLLLDNQYTQELLSKRRLSSIYSW